MRLKFFLARHWLFLLIVFVSLVFHLVFFFDWHPVWWDSGVYVGMGKFLFSFGNVGLWEHIRPVFWPFVLGFFWWLSLPVVFLGRVVELLMFLFSLGFVYFIGRKVYSNAAGLVAAAFLASSSILFYLSFHLYTEIPVMFFTLLAYFLFLRENFFWAGLFAGIAFLTKFPAGMFLVILFFFLLLKKGWRGSFGFVAGSALVLFPFFVSNLVFHGNVFGGLFAAQAAIRKVLGCNVLRHHEWYYYFFLVFFYENKFLLASVLGFFKRGKSYLLILFSALLPLLYFMQLSCRDYRYLVVFLPFVALLAGAGLDFLLIRLRMKRLKVLLLVILIIAISFFGYKNALNFYGKNEQVSPALAEQDFFQFLSNVSVSGEVWTSNPVLSVYSDIKLHKIYYPVFDEVVCGDFFDYLKNGSDKIEFVFLDNCGGGIICHPDDVVCKKKVQGMLVFLDNNFNVVLNETIGRCWYRVYKNPIF